MEEYKGKRMRKLGPMDNVNGTHQSCSWVWPMEECKGGIG